VSGLVPSSTLCETDTCTVLEVLANLFELRGRRIGIVREVRELRRVWFRGVCGAWGVAFRDQSSVLRLTPLDHPCSANGPHSSQRGIGWALQQQMCVLYSGRWLVNGGGMGSGGGRSGNE